MVTIFDNRIILSTLACSTAYSLSASETFIALECVCLILSQIAQHNLTIHPFVFLDDSIIHLKSLQNIIK
jgi:NAD+ kinase